jgi:hypothetical protein
LNFTQDIRTLFREEDIQDMKDNSDFDLSKVQGVRAHAADIHDRAADCSMPCDEAWSGGQIARFNLTLWKKKMN